MISSSRSIVGKQFAEFLDRRGMADQEKLSEIGLLRGEHGRQRMLLGLAGVGRLEKLFAKLFDENEFLSPHGLRALSAYHREHPYMLDVEGIQASIDYEPAESTTAMFGGNSNWRGPHLVPAELPGHHGPGSAITGSSATSSRSSTRPGQARSSPWTGSPPTCRTG